MIHLSQRLRTPHLPVHVRLALSSLLLATALPAPLLAQEPAADEVEAPIATLLSTLPEQVRIYDEHITFLSHPFLDGRLPGTRGMEIATEYVEHYYDLAGLERPYGDGASYRQGFDMGSRRTVTGGSLHLGEDVKLQRGIEFSVTGMGGGGAVTGPAVFIGYGIERGRDGYRGYADDTSLEGKIAIVLRFEPMDEEGQSLWSSRPGRWSARAGFNSKLRNAVERGAAGVIIVNAPGAADERVDELIGAERNTRAYVDVPVLSMLPSAAQRLLDEGGSQMDLMDLRREADKAGIVRDLDFTLEIGAEISEEALIAENVIGMLPGKGALAEEYVVIGGHLDHLGMGNFGSRSGPGKLHPGADDNASGSAAILMLADRLVEDYAALDPTTPARSILFMCFSAEESGLIGSQYYVENPLVPIESHKLMINFDMIGRITDKRLSVSGATTGEGMGEWLQPFFEATPLEIVQPENMSGASDHTPFYRAGMPVLFGILADFHDDYHTPEDVASKINRVDAVHTIDMFHDILLGAALRPEAFEYVAPRRRGPSRARPQEASSEEPAERRRVRLGVSLSGGADGPGIQVTAVHEGGAAHEAGMEVGDRLVKWNGKDIQDWNALQEFIGEQAPGDKVQVTLDRGGEEKVLWMTLQGPGGR